MIPKDVTIYDIAEALHISPATVSRGLKDHPGLKKDTKKRILDTAAKMGYQQNTFASNLRRRHSKTIGVIIPRLSSYFMATVISGMQKVAKIHGYNLIISQSDESYKNEIESVHTLFNSRIDGLMISLANDTPNADHFKIFLNKKIPLIFFDRVLQHPGSTSIIIDNRQAGYDATIHLIEAGCKRIVHLCGELNRNVYSDRLSGYKIALLDRGLTYDPTLVIKNSLTDEGGVAAAQEILNMKERPDGIFAANDTSAVACIRELKSNSIRIPEDIAIVGFNNDPISKVIEPNLTTIHYPGLEIGEHAATTLIQQLANSTSEVKTVMLNHKLIIRKSSKKNAA